ncbi:MAG: right-handed parallel beta-helix repeat-containing protein [Ferruginibacter sp.]
MKQGLSLLLITISIFANTNISQARNYYVSVTGSDLNVGYLIDAPFRSMKKALGKTDIDTIFVRGGIHQYTLDSTISVSKSGTAEKPLVIKNYQGETVIFDGSKLNAGKKGMDLKGSYWHLYGLNFVKARDNGMFISGAYNVVELCTFSENEDSGLQLSEGASNNQIINCDSYFNKDATSENADGFACKLDVGTGNLFRGCRAWQNSDDGWDGYIRPSATYNSDGVSTTLENCWSFRNGYLKTDVISGANGDGNGFKMGGSDNTDMSHNMTLTNCVSFFNRKRGFDQNNNRGSMTLYNNTAYANGGGNFIMNSISLDAGSVMTVKNCVAFNANGSAGSNAFVSGSIVQTNSWQSPVSTSSADFISFDTVGARGPRKPDGSLPDITFMHLAAGSDLIDAGQDVGLTYSGAKPDLGAFETTSIITLAYTFTGNGNWTDAANWLNNQVPPSTPPAGTQIIINPAAGGECILNTAYTVSPGVIFTVLSGKSMRVAQ